MKYLKVTMLNLNPTDAEATLSRGIRMLKKVKNF